MMMLNVTLAAQLANRQKEQLNEAGKAAQLGKMQGGDNTIVTFDSVQLTSLVPVFIEYGTRKPSSRMTLAHGSLLRLEQRQSSPGKED